MKNTKFFVGLIAVMLAMINFTQAQSSGYGINLGPDDSKLISPVPFIVQGGDACHDSLFLVDEATGSTLDVRGVGDYNEPESAIAGANWPFFEPKILLLVGKDDDDLYSDYHEKVLFRTEFGHVDYWTGKQYDAVGSHKASDVSKHLAPDPERGQGVKICYRNPNNLYEVFYFKADRDIAIELVSNLSQVDAWVEYPGSVEDLLERDRLASERSVIEDEISVQVPGSSPVIATTQPAQGTRSYWFVMGNKIYSQSEYDKGVTGFKYEILIKEYVNGRSKIVTINDCLLPSEKMKRISNCMKEFGITFDNTLVSHVMFPVGETGMSNIRGQLEDCLKSK